MLAFSFLIIASVLHYMMDLTWLSGLYAGAAIGQFMVQLGEWFPKHFKQLR